MFILGYWMVGAVLASLSMLPHLYDLSNVHVIDSGMLSSNIRTKQQLHQLLADFSCDG